MIDFKELVGSLSSTINTYDFFVDWKKVDENLKKIETELNILNYLLGKTNFKEEFCNLVKKYPEVIKIIPILLAVRNKNLFILDKDAKVIEYSFKKSKINDEEINKIYDFVQKTRLSDLFITGKIKNLVDYVFGIEVGLDTNARKNRTGKIMEGLIEQKLCNLKKLDKSIDFISQASVSDVRKKWNFDLYIEKAEKRFDFAVFLPKKRKLFLIEVNYYKTQGSKLKSTAGEYRYLNDFLLKQNVNLIWITDGLGWRKTKNDLHETFLNNKYVLNLNLVKQGYLERVLNEEF